MKFKGELGVEKKNIELFSTKLHILYEDLEMRITHFVLMFVVMVHFILECK